MKNFYLGYVGLYQNNSPTFNKQLNKPYKQLREWTWDFLKTGIRSWHGFLRLQARIQSHQKKIEIQNDFARSSQKYPH